MVNGRDEYPLAVALGSVYVAAGLVESERDEERKRKMRRVIDENLALIRDTWPKRAASATNRRAVGGLLGGLTLDEDTRRTLVIDIVFSDPFAPYELKYQQDAFRSCVEQLTARLDLDPGIVDKITDTRKDALKTYHRVNVVKMAVFGVGGAALLAAGGYVAAPMIAGYLGASAGLTGAAATLHGLALLGGGTLAAGGSGTAGGMALVTGVGAAAGGGLGTGGTLLFQMGAAGAKNELVKLQVNYSVVLLNSQLNASKAQQVTKGLAQRERELRKKIDEELKRNDENSRKIEELRDIVESVRKAREWMVEREAA